MRDTINLNQLCKRDIVFISTKNHEEDKIQCLRLCEMLEKAGINYWCMHKNNINLDQNDWEANIDVALERTVVFVILISENLFSLGQPNLTVQLRNELNDFKNMMKQDKGLKIIPVQLFEGNSVTIVRNDKRFEYNYTDILEKLLAFETSGNLFYTIDKVEPLVVEIINYYKEQCLFKHIERLERKSILLELQDYCLRKQCMATKVSDYILTSREFSISQSAELHIITNDFLHYDFTPLAKLAIAKNIKEKTIKYIYYYPKSKNADFKQLKEEIKEYALAGRKYYVEIDKWLRAKICKAHNLDGFLSNNFFYSPKSYITGLFDFEKLDTKRLFEKCVNEINETHHGLIARNDDIISWLNPDINESKRISSHLGLIEKFKEIIAITGQAKTNNEIIYKSHFSTNLLEKIKYIVDLYDFSEHFANNKTSDRFGKILDRLLDDNYVKNISEIRGYIEKKAALSEEEKQEIENSLQNIIGIEIPNDVAITMCYNFCLYIKQEDNFHPSVSWYDCDSNCNSTVTKIDEDIFIFAPSPTDSNDANKFVEAYEYLINDHASIRKSLEENKCNYLLNIIRRK